MSNAVVFRAPWGNTLTIVTALSCPLLIGASILLAWIGIQFQVSYLKFFAVFPVLVLLITAIFMVRGYEISGDRLLIQRLGWQTEIALNNLTEVTYDPEAMERSLRIFGNGGLFAFTGKFRNGRLGVYDAYATAPRLSVVLKLGEKKTIVVTPEKPEQFVETLRSL